MGLHKREKKMFLNISDGKIRMKSDKEDRLAEERYVEITGKYVYERVFSSCEGFLRAINVNTHEEYGTTYNLELYDPADGQTYSLGISEQSRYFQALAMHFPNFDFSKKIEVIPYSFKSGGRNVIGLSFKQDGDKVPNYYREITDESTDPPTTEPCNGLEQFDFTLEDKDELKIERLRQLKFLKQELKAQIIKLSEYIEENGLPSPEEVDHQEDEEHSDDEPANTETPEPESKKDNKKSSSTKSGSKTSGGKAPAKKAAAKKSGGRKTSSKKDDLPY